MLHAGWFRVDIRRLPQRGKMADRCCKGLLDQSAAIEIDTEANWMRRPVLEMKSVKHTGCQPNHSSTRPVDELA